MERIYYQQKRKENHLQVVEVTHYFCQHPSIEIGENAIIIVINILVPFSCSKLDPIVLHIRADYSQAGCDRLFCSF